MLIAAYDWFVMERPRPWRNPCQLITDRDGQLFLSKAQSSLNTKSPTDPQSTQEPLGGLDVLGR